MSLGILDDLLLRVDLVLLLFLRMLGLFATAPIWSNRFVPVQIRVALSFSVAVVVSPLFDLPAMPTNLIQLVPLALQELLVGMIVGFIASLLFAAVQFGGQLMDINMGLSIMNVLDPLSNTQVPVIGNLLYILALLIFFTINGHHMLLQAVMDSYVLVPIGTASVNLGVSEALVRIASDLFIIGFKISAPVLAALFLTTVALGVLNRAVPQMNVFIVGMPIQMAVGVFILVVMLPLYVTFLQVLFRGMAENILLILRLLKG